MSKELEALEALKMQVGNIHYFDFSKGYPNQTTIELRDSELFTTIKKSLKALEIIKETRVDTNFIKLSKNYDNYCGMEVVKMLDHIETAEQRGITQEEYDLLREVLL